RGRVPGDGRTHRCRGQAPGRVFGRHAPAGRHRAGAAQRSEAVDRGRADGGAGSGGARALPAPAGGAGRRAAGDPVDAHRVRYRGQRRDAGGDGGRAAALPWRAGDADGRGRRAGVAVDAAGRAARRGAHAPEDQPRAAAGRWRGGARGGREAVGRGGARVARPRGRLSVAAASQRRGGPRMSPASGSVLRSVGAVLVADLRQRLRAPRTWVVVAGLAALAWWCFPALETHYLTVSIDGVRGRYSSAWIGMIVALIYSMALSLFGFFLVRGTLVRDFETRAWQLLVATTMSRGAYLFAKWLSHMLLFAMVIAGGLAIGLVLQFVRAEDRHVDLLEMIKPVLVITLPSLALTATLAVWFDMLPWLRRSAGNVLFFVLWMFLLTLGTAQVKHLPGAPMPWPGDPHGMLMAGYELGDHWPVPAPDNEERGLNMGVHVMEETAELVDWTH